MAAIKLVGRDDVALGASHDANYISTVKFTAVATGNVTEMRFRAKANVASNVYIGIYADSGGSPAALLGQKTVAVSSGAERVIIVALDSAIPVVSGTAYWIAHVCTVSVVGLKAETSIRKTKAWTYAALPNPAGTGWTDDGANWSDITAGWGVLVLSPSGLSQPIAYGTPKLNLSIYPPGHQQAIAYGTPTVGIAGIVISPQGIAVIISYGTPALRYPQTISPPGLSVPLAYGTPSVGIIGIISPQGIAVIISYGTPTVLKYVWHVILDGQYLTETPETNRTFVIGRDVYGNPVWGEAQDSTEIGLVGERLDFQPDPAIPTTAQAADVAAAVLAKMRLSKKRGVILIPYNCGQELWDVVQITDAGANQQAVKFRVVGLRFEYNPKQARYAHKLILGAP